MGHFNRKAMDEFRKGVRDTQLPVETIIQASIAISLKRIADQLTESGPERMNRIANALEKIAQSK